MRWGLVQRIARLHRQRRDGVAEARRHLEQSRADRPAVERLARDLEREYRRNNFASRVDASLKGHR